MALELTFTITGEIITLGQFLKAGDVVGSGAQSKGFLSNGATLVNGEPEIRRGRKLRAGDVVTLPNGDRITIATMQP
ncbi:MAG: RNA-binding S4 domain-containing protein [Armatimonadetes bacterium]|nr:RNA-binding S4 domain-containing protein [Armatimonadota bacterium]